MAEIGSARICTESQGMFEFIEEDCGSIGKPDGKHNFNSSFRRPL
jgi:hypothetical protein